MLSAPGQMIYGVNNLSGLNRPAAYFLRKLCFAVGLGLKIPLDFQLDEALVGFERNGVADRLEFKVDFN